MLDQKRYFNRALVRPPAATFAQGLTEAGMGVPDIEMAKAQHTSYVKAFSERGVQIEVLPEISDFPDATFVEDVAVLTPQIAILTRPGAISRQGEVDLIAPYIHSYYNSVQEIVAPGTLEGGDVMQVGKTIYVGLSQRTNEEGIHQLKKHLEPFGYLIVAIPVQGLLHLKTGMTALSGKELLVIPAWENLLSNSGFEPIVAPPGEEYAVNVIEVAQGDLIMPAGNPLTHQRLTARGYNITEINMSEFERMDGGLTCLSLRF